MDKEFIDVAMSLNPKDKMINGERMEKWVLRKAFEDYLPDEILWRQKEQFSDGVGYSWIDTLKEVVEDMIKNFLTHSYVIGVFCKNYNIGFDQGRARY